MQQVKGVFVVEDIGANINSYHGALAVLPLVSFLANQSNPISDIVLEHQLLISGFKLPSNELNCCG